MSGFRTSRTGRKPTFRAEGVGLACSATMRPNRSPRIDTPGNDSGRKVSCPHEYILFQFWIYPCSCSASCPIRCFGAAAFVESPEPVEITSHRLVRAGYSPRRRWHNLAENQTFVSAKYPSLPYALRHSPPQTGCGDICSAVHHSSVVAVADVSFVGFYRSGIGKGNIVQRRIRQRNRTI